MFNETVSLDQSRILAELLDTALADNWNEPGPTVALLWQSDDDPDDLRLAVKHLEGPVEQELAALGSEWSHLAAAHSAVTEHPPAALLPLSGDAPVRITIAVDPHSQSGVIRHRNGSTEWFGAAVPLPLADVLRSTVWLEAA